MKRQVKCVFVIILFLAGGFLQPPTAHARSERSFRLEELFRRVKATARQTFESVRNAKIRSAELQRIVRRSREITEIRVQNAQFVKQRTQDLIASRKSRIPRQDIERRIRDLNDANQRLLDLKDRLRRSIATSINQ